MSRPAWRIVPVVCTSRPGDGAQQRRLSAARRAEERHELAALDVEVDVLERGERAEALREAADLQIGLRRSPLLREHRRRFAVEPLGAPPGGPLAAVVWKGADGGSDQLRGSDFVS